MAASNFLKTTRKSVHEPAFVLFLLIYAVASHGAVTAGPLLAFQLTVIAGTFFWLWGMTRSARPVFYRTPVDIPVLLFFLWITAAGFQSEYSYATRREILCFFTYGLIFYFIVNRITTREKIKKLAWGIAIFGGLYATAGLILIEGSMLGPDIFVPQNARISMTFANPNHFAGFLEMTAWLSIGLALCYDGGKRQLLVCMGVYSAAAAVFSLSRGGVIGLLGGLSFICLVQFFGKKKRYLMLTAGFAAIVCMVVVSVDTGELAARLLTLTDPLMAGKGRIERWKGVLEMALDYPVWGAGAGAFRFVFERYQSALSSNSTVNHAHNDYLEILAETGIPGLAIVIWAIAALFVFGIRKYRRYSRSRTAHLGLGALTACFSLLVHAMTDFNFRIPSNALLLTICAAVSINCFNIVQRNRIPAYTLPGFRTPSAGAVRALIVVGALLATGWALPPYLGERIIAGADAMNRREDYGAAANLLETAAKVDFGNADHYRKLGDLAVYRSMRSPRLKDRFFKDALAAYQNAVRLSPTNGYYYSKIGRLYLRSGDPESARAAFLTAADYSPVDPSIASDLGRVCLVLKETDQALEHYRRFIRLRPVNLVMALNELREFGAGYEEMRRIVPRDPYMIKRFANYLFSMDEKEQALQELSRAVEIDPSPEHAISHLQGIFKTRDYEKSLAQCDAYIDQFGPERSFLTFKIRILTQSGKTEQAAGLYRLLIQDDPDDHSLYLRLSNLYIRDGRPGDALSVLEKGLEKSPDNTELLMALANYERRFGQREKALYILKNIIQLKPNQAAYRLELGREFEFYQMYHEAINQWKTCLDFNPEYNPCRRKIKNVYRRLGLAEKPE